MTYVLDKTDFPYLALPAAGLAVGLLPVCKAQFEFYLGDPTGPGRPWYEAVLAVSPRASWRHPQSERVEELFLTGVLPEEAEQFACWIGPEFRLPGADDWRAADRELARTCDVEELCRVADDPRVHPAARAVLRQLTRGTRPKSWREPTLLENGLLEWVGLPAGGHGLYGRPRPALFKLLLNPQIHSPSRPRSLTRHRAFGFRLVRTLDTPELGP